MAISAETSYLVQKKEINISKHLALQTSYPYHKCLENFTTDWILSSSPHNKCSHLIFVLKLSEEQNIAADPQKLLDHVCAHLEQSYILWKDSVFCELKIFSEPSQGVVSGDNWERNFKISVSFSTKNASLNAACVRRNCLQASSYSSCIQGLISNNAAQV